MTSIDIALPAGIVRVSSIEAATADAAVFAEDEKTLAAALASSAGAIFARTGDDPRILVVPEPKLAFARAARALAPAPAGPLLHSSASVDATAKLAPDVRVAANAVIEADVVIGEGSVIGAGAKILQGSSLGARVVVQAGAVIGSTGFGFVRDPKTGEYTLFPQQGATVLEDDVEVGANSTIDRGALGETRIGHGTKIDNLVHIGHNCRIGRNVVIAAQVGISGSCVVEDGAILAGQVGISDHCHIGPGVILGGQTGVFRGATVEGPGQMFAGTPAEPLKNFLKSLARLRRLK